MNIETTIQTTVPVVLLGVWFSMLDTPVHAETYDLVILNGQVMDPETMFDGVRNVGVKDGKIAVITKNEIQGDETGPRGRAGLYRYALS